MNNPLLKSFSSIIYSLVSIFAHYREKSSLLKQGGASLIALFLFIPLNRPVLGGPNSEETEETGKTTSSAAEEIARWGTKPGDGPDGRPLPVTGSWNTGGYYNQPWKKGKEYNTPRAWNPTYFTELIKKGHHVLPTFKDPMHVHLIKGKEDPGDNLTLGDQDVVTPIKYCARHDLPFAFRDWNLAQKVVKFEGERDRDFSNEKSARLIQNGNQNESKASPIGPVERWREFGREWGSNPWFARMAEIYPDPPMIVLLNNNEAGHVRVRDLNEKASRFVERYGKNVSKERKREIIHKGYKKRYRALFEAAREAAPAEWGEALTFVAYNAFPWPKLRNSPLYQSRNPLKALEPDGEWSWHDGTMPEAYLNDWQIGRGKTDYSIWSPQHGAAAQAPLAEHIVEQNPQYYFSRISWEGGVPGKRGKAPNRIARGKIAGKPRASGRRALQMWDNDRYEGMLQFAMWSSRPRSFREFRGGSTRDAYYRTTWQTYLDVVDRVWNAPEDLKEFWKHGKIVRAPVPEGWVVSEKINSWYLLPSEANPSGKQMQRPAYFSRGPAELRIMAFALVLGEEPNRRWMVYAHAPIGAVADTTVTLPEYGEVTIPEVTRTGSFYVVSEADDSVEQVIRGGPHRITVSTSAEQVAPGEKFEVQVEATIPPEDGFDRFEWELGDAGTRSTGSPGTQTVSFKNKGLQMIRVTGHAGDTTVVADRPVYVGRNFSGPHHVELSDASAWKGPWKAVGEEWPGQLQTYRLAANATGVDAPLFGGTFVDDAERGRVVELAPEEGLWLHGPTQGAKNLTVEVEFKTTDANKLQVIMASGGGRRVGPKGMNLYLHNGTLYAGVLAGHASDSLDFSGAANPEKTGLENSYFLSGGTVEADQWHTATLVFEGAPEDSVRDNVVSLYLDGKRIDRGPGAKLPTFHEAPYFGTCRHTATHNKAGPGKEDGLDGRLSSFRYLHEARHP